MLLANTVYAMDETLADSNQQEEVQEPEERTGSWVIVEGRWMYQYSDDTYAADGLVEIDGKIYSFDSQGYMETGWKLDNGEWHYYTAWGACISNWAYVGGAYYYFDENGVMQTGWQTIDGVTYYLKDSGAMAVGWQYVDGNWYYFTGLGKALTGWNDINGGWYYLNGDGIMQTGWQYIQGKWYYLYSYGAMKTGWHKSGNTWYYLKPSGEMTTRWALVNSYWYLFNEDGAMQTGWAAIDGVWYYMNGSGVMQTGWQYIGGYKYYFNAGGSMGTDLRGMVSGPYHIQVNRSQNCVTVFAQEGSNKYAIPVKAFLCSTGGSNTPLGTFTMSTQYRWHLLYGAYGQYCSRITGHVLFHSVPYYRSGDIYSLMPGQFNRLGSDASAGCVRLTTGDAKWIYDNCNTGQTEITIYDGPSSSPLGRPVLPKIPYSQNWDPTDPAIYN